MVPREALKHNRIQAGVQVACTLQHLAAVAGLRPADESTRPCDDRARAALRDALGGDEVAKLMDEGGTWTEDAAAAEAMAI